MKEHVQAVVDSFLKEGRIDSEALSEAIRVGVRKRKRKVDPGQRRKWKEYYRKNRAKILRRVKQWARKNKAVLKQYAKKYRQMFGKKEGVDLVEDVDMLRDRVEELISFVEEIEADGTEELLSTLEELAEMLDEVEELDEEEVGEIEEMLDEIEKAILAVEED